MSGDEGQMIEVGVATMGLPFTEVACWAGEHTVGWLEVMVGPTFIPAGQPAVPDALDLDDVTRNGPGRVQEVLDRYGVRISALAPMLNLLDPDPAVRERRAAVLRQTIDACARLGVATVIVYGGSSSGMFIYGLPSVGPLHPSNTIDANLRLFADVMPPLAAYAESKGIRIALETAPRGEGTATWRTTRSSGTGSSMPYHHQPWDLASTPRTWCGCISAPWPT